MEEEEKQSKQQKRRKMKKRKRLDEKKEKKRVVVVSPNRDTLFAVILAALSSSKSHESLIKKCLNQLHLSLPQNLSTPILSLLPPLLYSKCDEIACRTAEIVGTASLTSLEMNEMIASQGDIIKCLISLLKHSNTGVQMAACGAVLDLSTTYTGRCRLLQCFAIETLMVCFFQASKSSSSLVSLWTDRKNGTSARIVFEMDEAYITLLHAALLLINSCTTEQLKEIPKVLSGSLLVYLKGLWEGVHKKMLCATFLTYSQGEHFYVSNIRINDLAETIFRLSLNDGHSRGSSQLNKIARSIFHSEETSFEHFVLNHWEVSPLLIRYPSKFVNRDNIFNSFVQIFKSKEVYSCLPSILKTLTSCPPIASDELDILQFLKEVRSGLGCPLIYQQDIRVVKARDSEMKLHYFEGRSESCCCQASQYLVMDDILKCEEAYREGYTIALRGMEFRYKSIAAIAEGLATLYGQPSAGVNMYLTPPNSQGLACHSDDHCVLVCQLIGAKQWKIIPHPSIQLPRLYDPVGSWHPSGVDECGKQFLLREGDVLYIPRGFPHEAHTIINDDRPEKIAGFSLHMTLSIEVEPPFEWEGFIHVALHHWVMKQNAHQKVPGDSDSSDVHLMAVKLMHVAVKLIADLDPTFRKACLVGAISLSLPEEWLSMNQRMIFNSLIRRINNELNFPDALEHVETSIGKGEDPFQEVRWLQNLMQEGETVESHHWHIAFADAHDCFRICNQQGDMVEAAFMEIKFKFCSEVAFEDVQQSYNTLLQKYRMVRKQYTNGMLALHCTGDKDGEPL